uniref:Uncharacterized protein n=2 Tax=Noccaea caerulescens TaxID=107243 RepID=A0A1J3GSK2_NOCCA
MRSEMSSTEDGFKTAEGNILVTWPKSVATDSTEEETVVSFPAKLSWERIFHGCDVLVVVGVKRVVMMINIVITV